MKFGFSVSGQNFFGLKALTLNNMVQDPSMLAGGRPRRCCCRRSGCPTARVGYAYVRLNGADYGLYADVETVDSVMAQRWFSGTAASSTRRTIAGDIGPGPQRATSRCRRARPPTSPTSRRSDRPTPAGPASWFDRMQPVADLREIVRAMAAEHYVGQWDGYSVRRAAGAACTTTTSSATSQGRFSMIPSGTDQTWTYMERSAFGAYGNGVLMRQLRPGTARAGSSTSTRFAQIAGNPALASLAAQARAIRAVIAPWRALDPRREQSVADGEAQADAKIAVMASRPAELAAWLESPDLRRCGFRLREPEGAVRAT